jgi:hypothetical protein
MAASRGMLYEKHVQRVWQHLLGGRGQKQALVVRVGGAHDRGVDLVAEWNHLQFLIQCKNLAREVGPAVIREMEASVADFQASYSPQTGMQVFGVVASAQGHSTHALQRAQASETPILCSHISLHEPLPYSIVQGSSAAEILCGHLSVGKSTRSCYEDACAAMAANPLAADTDWAALATSQPHPESFAVFRHREHALETRRRV